MRKNILSIILAIIMVISIIPITASATTYSGTCGENLTWTFDEATGTLTISGTGAMYDYDYNNRPWKAYQYDIETVVIYNGVTTIGDYSFAWCESLTSVTIPYSVTTIGDYAFDGCTSYLTSVTIPDSVTIIGDYAFSNCHSLASVVIGNSVTTIGDWAFFNCFYLTDITIPNSVTAIGSGAFCYCERLTSVTIPDSVITIGGAFDSCYSLTSITVDSNNKYYSNDEYGVLFNKDKTTIIQYPMGNTRTSYTIPNSVSTIDYGAFYDCDNLTDVTIPDSVTTIRYGAFYDCNSFTDVYYDGTEEEWNNISIGSNNEYLLNATIHYKLPSGTCGENVTWEFDPSTGTLTISGTGAMKHYPNWGDYWAGITDVIINDGVTTIGNSAFYSCYSLTSVTIPDSVTTIGDYAFCYCDSLTSVTIPDSVITIGDSAFDLCHNLASVTIGNSVTTIGDSAFSGCNSLTSVTIGDSVTTIGDGAFYDCYSLTDITIPNSVTTIGGGAFSFCTSLTSITIPNSVTIGSQAFLSCTSLTSVSIADSVASPDSVTTISDYAFSECWSLTSVTIGEGVTTIGDEAFRSCGNLVNFTVDSDNRYFSSDEYGVLFNKNKTKLIQYPVGNTRISYTIPNSVTTIGDSAFENCSNLIDIYFDGTEEEWDAIYKGIYNEPLFNATIHFLGEEVHECSYNAVVTPPTCTEQGYTTYTCECGESYVDNYVNATGHKDDDYKGYCDSCGENTPSGTCGENLTWTFDESTGTLTISGTGAMYDYDFNNCPWKNIYQYDIKTVVINDGVTTIGHAAFDECTSLTSVTIPDSVTTIGDYAFSYCYSLTSVTIPDSVTTIGGSAFAYCLSLTNVTIPDSVTTIGEGAFSVCSRLENITVESNNKYYSNDEYGVLFNKDKTTLIQYTNGNTKTSYEIPDSVTTIGGYAFYECTSLTDVYYYGTEEDWKAISIGVGNDYLCSLTIHYNYSKPFTGIDGDYFYKDGVMQKAYQLVEFEGNYYFIDNGNMIAKNTRLYMSERFIEGTGLKVGYYEFDADGKMILKNGPDGDYFYINGVRQNAYQLVEFEGDYYFINDSHKLAKNKRIYLSDRFVNGFTYADGTPLAVGYYEFDADGKMIINNGVVGDYFYENNVRLKAYQLVEFEGNYYFINDSHKLAKNKRIYLSDRFVNGFTYADGTPLAVGYYEFDADGKMIILNGPVGDYFYINGVRQNAYQLVEFEGNYYFINDSHKLAKNKRLFLNSKFLEDTGLAVGYYEFDADGKMIIE